MTLLLLSVRMPVYTYATEIHVDTQTHTLPHTFTHSQLSPGEAKEAPPRGQVLADVLVFWFWRPVFKMSEILQGLRKLPASH